jgi:ankyrin repeat protein
MFALAILSSAAVAAYPEQALTAADSEGRTALHLVAESGCDHLLAALLHLLSYLTHSEASAALDLRDRCGNTALHLACAARRWAVVQRLLAKDASAFVSNRRHETVLCETVRVFRNDLVVAMLERTTVAPPSAMALTMALRMACVEGNAEVVPVLLRHGAEVKGLCEGEDCTLLHMACRKGHVRVVRVLLREGVEVHARNHRGYTALSMAILRDRVDLVKELLEGGCDPTLPTQDWPSELHLALSHGHITIAKILLRSGCRSTQWQAAMSRRDCHSSGNTTFHLCVRHLDALEVCALLDRVEVDLDLQNGHGDTALHIASAMNREKTVRLLLQRGADRTIRNCRGRTAFDLTLAEGHSAVCACL